jgi:putative tryptophan/tyrosine transport system substrate-binding protein
VNRPPSSLTMLLSRHTRRREFITLLGGAAAAWPLAARAQQLAGKVPRIGFLQRIQNENVVAFIQGLRDAGYIDGQNAVIETRIFETTLDRLPDLANELVDLKCNVIVAASRYAFEAAMRATSTTPIVGIDLESDPVASGWAKSQSWPSWRQLYGIVPRSS